MYIKLEEWFTLEDGQTSEEACEKLRSHETKARRLSLVYIPAISVSMRNAVARFSIMWVSRV